MRSRSIIIALIAGCSFLPCGGCIFREIRDEVKASNAQIRHVEDRLASTQDAIDKTNSELLNLEQGLVRLDATNLSLKDVQDRLVLLRSINESLGRLDAHLASLRKTIGSIDSMIPFIDLGGDEPLPPPAAPASRPESGEPPGPVAVAAAPVAESRPAENAAAEVPPTRRDGIVGAWISQYPDQSVALVVLDGGRYLWQAAGPAGGTGSAAGNAAGGKWTSESGTWKREGKRLRLTPDNGGPKNAAPASPKPDAPSAEERTFEIIAFSARSMTLQAADGRLTIYAKP